MRRVIGLDIHRVFAEAGMLDAGKIVPLGRIGMTREHLRAFGLGSDLQGPARPLAGPRRDHEKGISEAAIGAIQLHPAWSGDGRYRSGRRHIRMHGPKRVPRHRLRP